MYEMVPMSNRLAPASKRLVSVHTRLFDGDIRELKRIAAEQGIPWQIELRMTVHRALKGQHREITILKEQP